MSTPESPAVGEGRPTGPARPARTAYLAPHYPALSHSFILREVQAVRREGVDVSTYTVRRSPRADMRTDARGLGVRFASSFAFNNVEAALRIPVMALMVESWHISSVLATALSLIVAFFARFLFHSLVVYAPKRRRNDDAAASEPKPDTAALRVIRAIDTEVMKPGEL